MKSKLLIFVIIISVMLPLFAIPTLASSKVVDISRPEGNAEIVTKDIFSICGTSIGDEAIIEFQYKDGDEYKSLLTTEGESKFTVGKIFGKDVQLKNKGVNKIRIIAYSKGNKDDAQIEDYTITLAEEKKKDNWLEKALNWFTGTDANEKK